MHYLLVIAIALLHGCATTPKPTDKAKANSKPQKPAVASQEARSLKFSSYVKEDVSDYFIANGNLRAQSGKLAKRVNNDTDDITALLKLTYLQYVTGEFEMFKKLTKNIKSQVNTSSSPREKFAALYLMGIASDLQGFKQKSREIFHDLTILKPQFPQAYTYLSMAYLKNLKPEVAEFVLRTGMQNNPNHPHLYNAMGLVMKNTSRGDESLYWYNQAILIDKNFQEALVNRASYYLSYQDYKAARMDLKRVLASNPYNADALILMAIVKINYEGDLAIGKHMLGRAIKAQPGKSLAKIRLAEVYLQEKRELGFARKLLESVVHSKHAHYSTIESARNYLKQLQSNKQM